MKLFIWNAPYDCGYGFTYAYAIAPDVDAARAAIRAGRLVEHGNGLSREVPDDVDVSGEPSRILEGPCGEVVQWDI